MPLFDYEKAKAWRLANRYTRKQISELTGFSKTSIEDFETGIVHGSANRPVDQNAMKRYRLCLAAVANGLGDWDWDTKETI